MATYTPHTAHCRLPTSHCRLHTANCTPYLQSDIGQYLVDAASPDPTGGPGDARGPPGHLCGAPALLVHHILRGLGVELAYQLGAAGSCSYVYLPGGEELSRSGIRIIVV